MLIQMISSLSPLVSLLAVWCQKARTKCVRCTCWKRRERRVVTLVMEKQRPSAPTLAIIQMNNGRLPSRRAKTHVHNRANGPNYTSVTLPDPSDLDRLHWLCLADRHWREIDDTNAARVRYQSVRRSQYVPSAAFVHHWANCPCRSGRQGRTSPVW